ncbi:hypothetical protein ACQP2U_43770 (plasmid) [Nocardia sp. CA-084685]|uniref:hypothetical protein n=1 Tax=Nocardia sp. CA-084685 TaxID=3239970 RepID=UPI003D96F154
MSTPDEFHRLTDAELRSIAETPGTWSRPLAQEVIALRARVTELEASARRLPVGFIVAERYRDGGWMIAYDGAPWPDRASARNDLPALPGDWRVLTVYDETGARRVAALHAAALEESLGRAWDAGNAAGLDGWIGPGRGEQVDEEALRYRERDIDTVMREALDDAGVPSQK